jgi:hypothetical protein
LGDLTTNILVSIDLVAEEGVSRKGTVLLGPAEMEGEYAEKLRKEVSKILELWRTKSDCSL